MKQLTVLKLGKEYDKSIYCHSGYLIYTQSTSLKCWAGWLTSWSQDCWEKYQQAQICRWYQSNGIKWRTTIQAFDKCKIGEWKSWLKTQYSNIEDHGICSHHFMTNRWGNNGNSDKLYFLGLQNHCRWWLRPWNLLLPGRKAMTNLDILKSRDITLLTKVCIVKAMVFPVVVYLRVGP